jgi:hypothetical protein
MKVSVKNSAHFVIYSQPEWLVAKLKENIQ